MKNFTKLVRLFLTAMICLAQTNLRAVTQINVETAGTLSSLLTSTDNELKVTGFINGTDIKFIRQLVEAGTVTSLDWSEVKIVAGGEAYYENFTTTDNTIGKKMFYYCSQLQAIVLPTSLTVIGVSAFDNSGLKSIIIPDKVRIIEDDAFGGCSQLATVVIGKRVSKLKKGVFYGSAVKKAYVKPLTPPATPSYMFSSNPTIYVYRAVLTDYRQSGWKDYGTLSGTLDRYYPQEPDEDDVAKELCANYFEDAACTQLKPEYQEMSDEELKSAMESDSLPELMVNIALKMKNNSWAPYEKDFRIHNYKPYSDANYWNEKMMSSGGSFMGNPTGIYAEGFDTKLYVFVDDVPSDATLYIAWCEENDIISGPKTGQKLAKGLNIIDGMKDALYYILYTANTTSMTKMLSEWPDIKIHIEGGMVNGYYDVSRHSDADYKAILNAATLNRFTVRGGHSLYHLKTATFKSVFPNSIDKSIAWFDSVAVWQKNLMGMTEEVASGKKAGYPWYLTGGEAIYPLYYNNPNFAIEGDGEAYAHSSAYLTSYNSEYCIQTSLNALNPEMDDWCAGHECGHNNQQAINLEGGTEVSNNLFSNLVRYLGGLNTSVGSPLSTVMEEFAQHKPFYFREVDSQLRMYWNLYLYYHLGQKNTSFYPELFKALRKDKLILYNSTNNNNGGLKFVRKVCEIAGEDLTDFFTIWGFFEPIARTTIDGQPIAVTSSGITTTKDNIAQYEKKNREIIFVEDRADYVLSTGFLQEEGKKRRDSDRVGQCGDLGQFWDYWPEACTTSEYTYLKSDSLYAFEGTGGVGFLMLDDDNNIKYAANAKNLYIPTSIGQDFTIYSCDADGSLHEVTKAGNGTEAVELSSAGKLQSVLENDQVIKLIVSGRINGRDIKHMRQLISDNNLQSIDLSQAHIVSGGGAYYQSYTTSLNTMGDYAFADFKKLISIKLPSSITKIDACAFDKTGLKTIIIPDKVTTVGHDAFGSSSKLRTVVIGKKVTQLDKGTFYGSGVKDAYVIPLTPPSVGPYLFSSNPTIHVYASALEAYQNSQWAEYGTIVGDLTDEIIDSIENLKDFKDINDPNFATYDLMGRRVTEMKPGTIYIRNGKKAYVK